MAIEIIVPTLGESVSDATVARWIKASGDNVAADEPIVELETDKVTLEVPSPVAGQLGDIVAAEGAVVEVGAILAHLEERASAAPVKAPAKSQEKAPEKAPAKVSEKVSEQPLAPDLAADTPAATTANDHLSPAVRRLVAEHNIDPARLTGTGVGGRLTKADVLNAVHKPRSAPAVSELPATPPRAPSRDVDAAREERVPMSKLRKIIASRLKSAQNNAAMLTTFNEVDMTALMQLRTDFKDAFEMAHEIRLGFMGVFVQAAIQALREFPAVNAEIDGADIIYKNYYNIGVAVGTPQGLVVPVIKDAGTMDLAATEQAIADFGARAREGKIAPDEMAGGSFTISNGGV